MTYFLIWRAGAPKIDEQPRFASRRPKVTQDLCDVLIGRRPDCLELDDESVLHEQVGEILSQRCPILVVNRERVLLEGHESLLAQPMAERVLVDLFEMTVPVKAMNREARFANNIAELVDAGCAHATPEPVEAALEARRQQPQIME